MQVTSVYHQNVQTAKEKRIIVNQGGTSSSKTWTILQLLYFIADVSNKGLIISVVAESLPHLKRGAMRDFFNMLNMYGIYNRRAHNKSDNTYRVGSSLIEFFSADDDSKVRGGRRDILFINECNNVPYPVYDQLEVRTKRKIFLDFNPVSEFWAHTKVLGDDDVGFIQSTYLDNEFLDQRIVKSIEKRKTKDPNWWKVFGLGEIGSLEGLIYNNVKIIKEFPKDIAFWYGMDFGFTNDPTTLIKIGVKEDDMFIEQLIYQTRLLNNTIIDKMKAMEVSMQDEIFADSAEPKSIQEIYNSGFNIHPTEKGKDSVINGINVVKRYNLHVVDTGIETIKEFRNYQWMQDKEGRYINKPNGINDHSMDAIRYGAFNKLVDKGASWVDNI